MIKKGKRNGIVRYFCGECGRSFSSKRRPGKFVESLWQEHAFRRQTVADLVFRKKKSKNTIRKILSTFIPEKKTHRPRSIVLVADATFFGRGSGILVGKDPNEREVLYVEEIMTETAFDYAMMRNRLEKEGYVIQAVVVDGKRCIPNIFKGMPVQICQFHQIQIVRRKLTLRPKTQAGVELLSIGLNVDKYTKEELEKLLCDWHERHQTFLEEKTYCSFCKKFHYTHRRLRGAYRSLMTNLESLFTYEKYPDLHIPNTTNCLDGQFSQLKEKLGAHRGQTKEKRLKMIRTLLKV